MNAKVNQKDNVTRQVNRVYCGESIIQVCVKMFKMRYYWYFGGNHTLEYGLLLIAESDISIGHLCTVSPDRY